MSGPPFAAAPAEATVRFRLDRVVDDVLSEVDAEARSKTLNVQATLRGDLPHHAPGESSPLRDALACLVGEAIRRTRSGGVHLRLVPLEETEDGLILRCEVEDSSPSDALEDGERLFDLIEVASRCGGPAWSPATSTPGGAVGIRREPGRPGGTFWFTAHLAA